MLRSLFALRVLNAGFQQTRLATTASVNTLKVKDEVKRKRELALLGGGQKRIDAQHKKGDAFSTCEHRSNELVLTFFRRRKTNGS